MYRKISIKVSDFGPIKTETVINLNQFMVFSGESGVGKSYLAMLTHYVYRVILGNELDRYFLNLNLDLNSYRDSYDNVVIYRLKKEDFISWINERALAYMKDMLGNPNFSAHIEIDLPDLPDYFEFKYSKNVVEFTEEDNAEMLEFLSLDDIKVRLLSSTINGALPYLLLMLLNLYLKRKYEMNCKFTFFMPPSRGSLVAVPENFIMKLRDSMGMYKIFLNDLAILKSITLPEKLTTPSKQAVELLNKEILHGNMQIKDNDIIYHVADQDLPITAAASSIKELAPFALMVQKDLMGLYSILFEEPESHLHPELQVKVADLLSYAIQEGTHLQITTHSDYFLRRINDLIRLNILKSKLKDDEKFQLYCKENGFDASLALDSESVSAFYLKSDSEGGVKVIKQDISTGIPFDTFKKVVEEQTYKSSELYDKIDFFNEDEL